MASSSHFLLNSHVPVFEQGRSSPPCTVTQLALNSPVAKFEITASTGTKQAVKEKQKHPCAHLLAGELWLDFSFFPPHLLQQFVSFRLQQRGEIVIVCRDLSTSSFLLLQFSDHLLNIHNEKISHIPNISVASKKVPYNVLQEQTIICYCCLTFNVICGTFLMQSSTKYKSKYH